MTILENIIQMNKHKHGLENSKHTNIKKKEYKENMT